MSLTGPQATKVRRYLGYPDVNRELHHTLEGALVSLSSDGETEVVSLLEQLAELEASMQSGWQRLRVVKAEDVTLAGPAEIQALRAEGDRLAGALATLLGVPVRGSPFSGGGGAGLAGRG